MNIEFKTFIDLVLNDKLDLESTMKAFNLIMNGSVSDIQISSFLSILQKSGVSADHMIGAIKVMRSKNGLCHCPRKFNGYMWNWRRWKK